MNYPHGSSERLPHNMSDKKKFVIKVTKWNG